MKNLILLLLLSIPFLVNAQAPNANLLVNIHVTTTAEKNSITNVAEGSLIYDKDQEALNVYNDLLGWQKLEIGPTVYTGSFIINAAGALNISGLPFKPSQVTFSAHANVDGYNLDSDNGVGNNATNIHNSHGSMNGFAREGNNGAVEQQVIYSGGSGNSINDISLFASDANCIGIRYGNQNGDDLGKILASFSTFTADGFDLNVSYTNGTITNNTANPLTVTSPTDVLAESVVVIYTAYR